jgi:hypothetical protein
MFTQAERNKIHILLGYPVLPFGFSDKINTILTDIENSNSDIEEYIKTILVSVATRQSQIDTLLESAQVSSLEGITMNPSRAIQEQKRAIRNYSKELATILNVERIINL